ncbi:MAG: transglycosylase SLT domain-containing protein [Patescibacteria group bacterium]|jgi:soluble lytic murein transglycosylase
MKKQSKLKLAVVIISFILLLFSGYLLVPTFFGDTVYPLPKEYAPKIVELSDKYDVPPAFFAALIFAESGFHATSRSSAGAVGLTQMMPSTARYTAQVVNYTGKIDLTNPDVSLELGAAHLSILFKEYNTLNSYDQRRAVLASYNAGGGVGDAWVESGLRSKFLSRGVEGYVNKIMFLERVYEQAYADELGITEKVSIQAAKPNESDWRSNFWYYALSRNFKLGL